MAHWLNLVVSGLAQEAVEVEALHVEAVAEAATYRQLLSLALDGWVAERRRANALQLRLQQLAGFLPWHREEVDVAR